MGRRGQRRSLARINPVRRQILSGNSLPVAKGTGTCKGNRKTKSPVQHTGRGKPPCPFFYGRLSCQISSGKVRVFRPQGEKPMVDAIRISQ